LNTSSVHSVLSKIASLTNERDFAALEYSLAQVLFDLIAPVNLNSHKSVVIYHVKDIEKQIFSAIDIGGGSDTYASSPKLNQKLAECFKSGEVCTYEKKSSPLTTLYPLKDAKDEVMAILAVEVGICSALLHDTIIMLLHIYQNFTGLIHENEKDSLTGLLNRKTFESKINKVLAQMHQTIKRKGDKLDQVYFLAIFDIDHFKKVNDKFGHLIGDEVLLLFSRIMTQSFRGSDLLFRFGGEEFVCVFECANAKDIELILGRFRSEIENFKFPQVGKVTVSSGYTEIFADAVSSQLIDRADVALYYAKNNGRNRICYYEKLIADGALQENKIEGDIELF